MRRQVVAVSMKRVCACGRLLWSPRWPDAASGPQLSQATADHLIARCFGGATAPENFDVICMACNRAKGRVEKDLFEAHEALMTQRGALPFFLGGRL